MFRQVPQLFLAPFLIVPNSVGDVSGDCSYKGIIRAMLLWAHTITALQSF